MNKGFTIIETLVVIAILAIVGVLVLSIFTQSLKGSNKAQVLSSIKKNGQAVLETMDKTIRDADNVICPYISPGSTGSISSNGLVVDKNGVYTRYTFIAATATQNGSIQQDNPTRGATERIVDFANRVCNPTDPLLLPITLTDINIQTGASIQLPAGSFLFTRNKSVGFKDTAAISFQVAAPVGAPPSVAGQIDPVSFSETVELR